MSNLVSSNKTIAIGIVAIASLIVSIQTFFVVNEAEQALVLRFGELQRVIKEPGLNLKMPFVENTRIIEKRILNVSVNDAEIIAADEKRFVVDAFARYEIEDPVEFYRTMGGRDNADMQMKTFLNASIRRVLGQETLMDVLSDKRDDFMLKIAKEVSIDAKKFGIKIVDVRIQRADLPKNNSAAIYDRMIASYDKQALSIRSEGDAQKIRIESEAKRQAEEIRAKARKEAEIMRGDADSERNKIFAVAYEKDPEFFKFYRSLMAYQKTFAEQGNTSFVLSPSSEFLKYMNSNKANE